MATTKAKTRTTARKRAVPADPPAPPAVKDGTTLEHFNPGDITFGSNYRIAGRDPATLTQAERDELMAITPAWVEEMAATGGNSDPVALLNRVPAPGPDDEDQSRYVVAHDGGRRVRGCDLAGVKVLGYVLGDQGDPAAEQLARVVAQYRLNHQRQDTSAAADAHAIQQMLDLGLDETQVCRTLRLPGGKDAITAARKVTAATAAAALAAQYPIDLFQTAQAASFEESGDMEAVEKLRATLADEPEQYAHQVQKLTDSAVPRAERRAVLAALEAAGVTVVEADGGTWQYGLAHLHAPGTPRVRLTEETHRDCPGHAAYVDDQHQMVEGTWRQTWHAVYMCTDPDANGHESYSTRAGGRAELSPAERQAQLAAKRRTRAGNKEWKSATTLRRQFINDRIVAASTVPRGWPAAAWRLAVLATDSYAFEYAMNRHHPLACFWLHLKDKEDTLNGDRDKLAGLTAAAAPGKQAVIELLLLVAAAEHQAAKAETWDTSGDYGYRNLRADMARYLRFLASIGYTLSPVEAHVADGGKTGTYTPEVIAAFGAEEAIPDGIVMCETAAGCTNGPHPHEVMPAASDRPCAAPHGKPGLTVRRMCLAAPDGCPNGPEPHEYAAAGASQPCSAQPGEDTGQGSGSLPPADAGPAAGLPRAECPACHADVATRKDGELREHPDHRHDLYGVPGAVHDGRVPQCPMSGRRPEDGEPAGSEGGTFTPAAPADCQVPGECPRGPGPHRYVPEDADGVPCARQPGEDQDGGQ